MPGPRCRDRRDGRGPLRQREHDIRNMTHSLCAAACAVRSCRASRRRSRRRSRRARRPATARSRACCATGWHAGRMPTMCGGAPHRCICGQAGIGFGELAERAQRLCKFIQFFRSSLPRAVSSHPRVRPGRRSPRLRACCKAATRSSSPSKDIASSHMLHLEIWPLLTSA